MPHDCSYKGDQSVEVWFDPPELQLECRVTASEKLMMIFGSTVRRNSQADVLIDSGLPTASLMLLMRPNTILVYCLLKVV